MLALIDNYDSFTHNLAQLFGEVGCMPMVLRNDAVTVDELIARKPAGLIVSPGPGTPDEAGISMDAIRAFLGRIPVLGVCLGHQCLARVLGAVVRRGHPMHGKASWVQHDGRGLFAGVPSPFLAARYHSLVVDETSVRGPLAVDARAPDGAVMAVSAPELGAHGVQFHPESFLTSNGSLMASNFVEMVSEWSTSPTR